MNQDVKMPDGTIVRNVPEGATKADVMKLHEAQQAEAFVAEAYNPTIAPDDTMGEIRSMLEGATLGFADEAGLGVAAGAAAMKTGDNFFDIYKNMRERYNQEQAAYEASRPVYSVAANVMGGMGTGAGAYNKLFNNPIVKANPLKTASVFGATTGATAGAGFAPTLEDVPAYMATGGVSGAALPLAFTVGGKVLSPIAKGVKNAFTFEKPNTAANRVIGKFLSDDLATVESIQNKLAGMRGMGTLADVGGENTKGLARAVATHSGPGKEVAKKFVVERQRGSFKRLMGTLKKLSGGDDDYFNNMQNVLAKRKEQAAPLYQKAYRELVQVDDDLADMFNRPAFQTALRKARKNVLDDPDWPTSIKIPEKIESGQTIPLGVLDQVKKSLDATAFGRNTPGDKATNYKALRTMLVDKMDNMPNTGSYQRARQIYSDSYKIEEAIEAGTKILTTDGDEVAAKLADLSKAEQDAYINGALKTIKNKLMGGREDANAATRLATMAVRDRLRNAFPDDRSYAQFISTLDIEDDFARTYQQTFGGSPTQPRQVGEKELAAAYRGSVDFDANDQMGLIAQGIKKIIGSDDIPQPIIDEIQAIMFKPGGPSKADLNLLSKFNINEQRLSDIKNMIPAALSVGTETGFAGAITK